MNPRSRSLLSRRNVLRGAGVCIALPWLESLAPRARAQQLTFPKRFLPLYFPNGADTQWWDLSADGVSGAWQLSQVLSPFTPLKNKLIVLDGLGNYRWQGGDPFALALSHARLTGAFLTCVNSINGTGEVAPPEISADQIIAQLIGKETALASLQLGLSTMQSSCDGLPCEFSRCISWAGSAALPKEVNPQVVFDRLFGDPNFLATEGVAKYRALDQSVLDYVKDSAEALQPKLGSADRERVDEFLTSVSDVETRAAAVPLPSCAVPERPTLAARDGLNNGDEGYSREEHAEVMNDLIVLAFQCDATRVISHMLDDSRSDFDYSHVPVLDFGGNSFGATTAGNFHGASSSGEASNTFASINHWLNQKVASLCLKLDAISEGEGTLLDRTAVFYASDMAGGNHSGTRIPAVLLGGGGSFKGDTWMQYGAPPGDSHFRDLYFSLMSAYFELNISDFGTDFTGAPPRLMSEILV